MDCVDAACWSAKLDAAPWAGEALSWASAALSAARRDGNSVAVRRLQRLLAAEFGPDSAWAATNDPDVVRKAEIAIEIERGRWLEDSPLTSLSELGVTPYPEPLDATRARVHADPEDLRAWLTLGNVYESQRDDYRARVSFARVRSLTDDPVVLAYSFVHGEWPFCMWTPSVAALVGRLDSAPAALRGDLVDVFVASAIAEANLDDLEKLEDEEALRYAASVLSLERPGDLPRVLDRLIARDPADRRMPMWRWMRWKADRTEESRNALLRFAGPDSSWWASTDAEVRLRVVRLLDKAGAPEGRGASSPQSPTPAP